MHHFLYPTQDTFITNTSNLSNLNFGLNEILRIGTENVISKVVNPTTLYPFSQSVTNICVINYSGSIIGFISGSSKFSTGTIYTHYDLTSSYFSGSLTGSFFGSLTGSFTSASINSSSFTGSLNAFSGSAFGIFSGSSYGISSGSIFGSLQINSISVNYFNGYVSSFTGKIFNGFIVGIETINQQQTIIAGTTNINRSLIQFDISSISKSISDGTIVHPNFVLKMKTAREENLPIKYSLYAFPISESWVMGNGYFFDGGSTQGVSWNYRDAAGVTSWNISGSTYINSVVASQSFDYESGDISMNVTQIVNSWLNKNISNNGLVILSSEEFNATGSGMTLYFFSRDTNTIYSPYLDASWSDAVIITGSVETSSVTIATISPGVTGSYDDQLFASVNGIDISGSVFGVMDVVNSASVASGLVSLSGTSGTINGDKIYGSISGSIVLMTLTSSFTFPGFGPLFDLPSEDIDQFIADFRFFPFVTTTNTVTTTNSFNVLYATFLDGNYSGSVISCSITNNVQLTGGITGSYLVSQSLSLTTITASYPFLNFPSAVVTFNGPIISGTGFGSFSAINYNPGSGIWTGTIIDGILSGMRLVFPFSGSISTSSLSYTSSVIITSSSLQSLNIDQPFVITTKIPQKVKTNEIIKVKVFGREQFPLKNFQRTPQFSQYITPLYLPTSSYYAIKDNETEETILDFDQYTQISCDPSGSYFMLDTSGLPQERYFKIIIKIVDGSLVYVIDNSDIFKVVR